MDTAVRHFLERTNPWLDRQEEAGEAARARLPAVFIERDAGARLDVALGDPIRAHLVIGPRQAGKSTLIWQRIARRPRPLLYLNCEEPIARAWSASPALVAADLRGWLPDGGLVFLEEAQWLPEAGLFIKGLVDAGTGLCIVVSGSASFHLLARTRESLAGRATRQQIWPLSLGELTRSHAGRSIAARRQLGREVLERMLVLGGYPAVWNALRAGDDPAPILGELVTAFVLRDASDRFRIERPDAFRRLLQLAATQVGDLINVSEWSALLGVSAGTVNDYANLLEETHVLRLIRPYIGGKRAELTRRPKVFYLDNGLRNAVAGGFAPLDTRADTGKLLECWVFSELHKRFPEPGGVRYWRTRNGAEVDFVIEPTPGRVVAIEVKMRRGRPPTLPRALRSFIGAYAPERAWLVHRGEAASIEVGDTRVDWIPAELLPDHLDALAQPA